jgi:ATP-dependent Clp protease protease subunit
MTTPIRLFAGSAKPFTAFWKLRNAAETGADPEIEFDGVISEYSFFGDEVTPKMFKDDLNKIGQGGPVTLRINSPGGDVIAASVIRSILVDYPGKVTARIDGICASAATIVALGGDVVRMQDSSYMMIHDPAVGIMGYYQVEELALMIDTLKSIKDGIVNVYEGKTGMSRDRLGKLMKDETWMDATEATRLGFADEVIGGKTKAVSAETISNLYGNIAFVNALQSFINVPPALLLNQQPGASEKERQAQRLAAHAKQYLIKE